MCPGVVCDGVFVLLVAAGVLLECTWTKDLHFGRIMRVGVSSLCFLLFGFCAVSFFFWFVLALLWLLLSFLCIPGLRTCVFGVVLLLFLF